MDTQRIQWSRTALAAAVGISMLLSASALAEAPYQVAWMTQYGKGSGYSYRSVLSGSVYDYGVSADALGNIYTGGQLIAKHDALGNLMWSTGAVGGVTGNYYGGESADVSADNLGNVYDTGNTYNGSYNSYYGYVEKTDDPAPGQWPPFGGNLGYGDLSGWGSPGYDKVYNRSNGVSSMRTWQFLRCR